MSTEGGENGTEGFEGGVDGRRKKRIDVWLTPSEDLSRVFGVAKGNPRLTGFKVKRGGRRDDVWNKEMEKRCS